MASSLNLAVMPGGYTPASHPHSARKARETAVFIFSIALFAGSYLYLLDTLKAPAFALFIVATAGLFIVGVSKKDVPKTTNQPKLPLIIVGLFWYVSLFAALWNRDAEIAAGATFVFSFYVVARLVMRRPKALDAVVSAFFFTTTAVIVASVVVQIPTIGGSYAGVFNNPNALGGVLATFATALIARAMTVSGVRRSWYVIAIMAIAILTLLTRNRAAIGAIVACFAIVLALWLPTAAFRLRSLVLLMAACVTLPFILSYVWPTVIQPVADKFLYNEGTEGGVTSGRSDIWMAYLSQSTLLGRGRDILDMYEHAAHNTYISLIAQFGWIAGLLFLFFVLTQLVQTWILRHRSPSGYLAFMSVLTFLILSLTEGMLMKSTMFTMLLFASVPAISKDDTDRRGKTGHLQ